jgi:uncharacterized OsmC-like protein
MDIPPLEYAKGPKAAWRPRACNNEKDAMSTERIKLASRQVAEHFAEHPEDARSRDVPATAILESGLRCRAQGPNGATLVSDMPAAIGGAASAPSPGWLLRAALANCDATLIAMRAAQLGIVLSRLEVTVDSESDDRGLLGVSDSVPPGPLTMRVGVRIAADGTSSDQLRELVHWAEQHSPVSDAVRRAVPVTTDVMSD